MLRIGDFTVKTKWEEADIVFTLKPLLEDMDSLFREQSTEREVKNDRIVDIKVDQDKYAELVGLHCIKQWTGVVDEREQPAECNDVNIARLMKVGKARDFIMGKVKALQMHVVKEEAQAKEGSPPLQDGTAGAETKP